VSENDALLLVNRKDRMDIRNDDDVIVARQKGRLLAGEIGFSTMEQAMLAAVITELARNIVDYAGRGEMLFQAVEDQGRRGIVVIARDEGPGIPNLKEALQASYSIAGGLGLGLRGIKALMDSLDIVSVPGKRTTVTARKWQTDNPPAPWRGLGDGQ
jgi:serine/threonine-protein kinase RsbT